MALAAGREHGSVDGAPGAAPRIAAIDRTDFDAHNRTYRDGFARDEVAVVVS